MPNILRRSLIPPLAYRFAFQFVTMHIQTLSRIHLAYVNKKYFDDNGFVMRQTWGRYTTLASRAEKLAFAALFS